MCFNKFLGYLIGIFFILISPVFAAGDCIPGDIMASKPNPWNDTAGASTTYEMTSGYIINDPDPIPNPDESITIDEETAPQMYFRVNSSDWCYSPSTHAIIFLRKPLTVTISNLPIPFGTLLFINYHRKK